MKLNKQMSWKILQNNKTLYIDGKEMIPEIICDDNVLIWELNQSCKAIQKSQVIRGELIGDILHVKTSLSSKEILIYVKDR